MKLVHKDIIPRGPGTVKVQNTHAIHCIYTILSMKQVLKHVQLQLPAQLVPGEPDDLWHVYNLISKGDRVLAVTVRKVQRESSSGDRDVERVKLKLEIEVEAIDYDNVAAILRVRGKNVSENEHVKIGAFHTLEIETQRPFVLKKDVWDSMALDTLKQACDPGASADLAVVLMQEGLAHILLVGRSVNIMCELCGLQFAAWDRISVYSNLQLSTENGGHILHGVPSNAGV
ncbi:hypothetical protein KI387_009422 [Taxus chinensis]|uniref:eRF1/Pelota-like N-terminal domain-containing protein n=1 Tax=Taxus chinensis TaxID=29808 RepID=A0AA38FIZ3_TAXCH|nr:hypothetical protein KI387_009422 [Taxus chinensis]